MDELADCGRSHATSIAPPIPWYARFLTRLADWLEQDTLMRKEDRVVRQIRIEERALKGARALRTLDPVEAVEVVYHLARILRVQQELVERVGQGETGP